MGGIRRMIDFCEFAGAMMRPFALAGSGEELDRRLVDGKAHDLVRHSFGGGETKPAGAAE